MRKVNTVRLTILSLLLAVTALLVQGHSGKGAIGSVKEPLQQVFGTIRGWHAEGSYPMGNRIVEALMLDDYLFQAYRRESGQITLYVGYYHTAKKVGAAHDPLVCFQGQGWQLGNRESGEYHLSHAPGQAISYSSMIAERENERELIVYWFQAGDKATAGTPAQKMAMLRNRLLGRGENNAFVRISAAIGDESPENVKKRIFSFIDDFYPAFYQYVTQG